jgi:hypothetical protein
LPECDLLLICSSVKFWSVTIVPGLRLYSVRKYWVHFTEPIRHE